MPDFYLLGAGAMGTVAAHRLQLSGMSVAALYAGSGGSVLHRHLLLPEGREQPLTLPLAPPNGLLIQRLLLATKGPDSRAALQPWLAFLAPDCQIIRLQNGIHTLRDIALPPQARVIHWVTTDAAWKEGDQVHWVAANESWLGDGSGQAPEWFDVLSHHWPRLHWVEDIELHQWRKLAVNAVINPLTALHRCRNGELLQHPQRRQQMRALAQEVDCLAARKFPQWPCDTLERSVRVCEQTANNRSSMLVDVEAGRATELAFINGALLDEAHLHNVELPTHRGLVAALQAQ